MTRRRGHKKNTHSAVANVPSDEQEKKSALGRKLNFRRHFQNAAVWLLIFGACGVIFWLLYSHEGPYPEEGAARNNIELMESFAGIRDLGHVNWGLVPMLMVVMRVFFVPLGQGDWSAFLASFGVILFDWFNELWNALAYTITGYAAPWMCVYGNTSYQITVGWNIEIVLCFLLAGPGTLALLKHMHKNTCFLGINNRHWVAVFCSVLHLVIETVLNRANRLLWSYWWWNDSMPYLPFIVGYLPFYELVGFIYDAKRGTQLTIVFGMVAVLGSATVYCLLNGLI